VAAEKENAQTSAPIESEARLVKDCPAADWALFKCGFDWWCFD